MLSLLLTVTLQKPWYIFLKKGANIFLVFPQLFACNNINIININININACDFEDDR
jgi:hypothetical protein